MTADELERYACDFVEAATGLTRVARGSAGVVELVPPYAVVSLVSDEDDGGMGDAVYDPDTGVLVYTEQRLARLQLDIIGTPEARNLAQRVGMLWRTDCAARRALVVQGLAPTRAVGLRATAPVRGGSGVVQSAGIDLLGYHRLTLDTDDGPSLRVDAVDADVTGVDGPDVVWTEYVYALGLSDGGLLAVDGGTLAVVETAP